MRKVFLDANVVIDYVNPKSLDHSTAAHCIQIIQKRFGKPVVSPASFLITYFIMSKFTKNEPWLRKRLQSVFSSLEITPIHPSFIAAIFKTYFTDLEDAIQHQCAAHAKAKLIVTKDTNDFFDSKIPVLHPDEFVIRYSMAS